MDLFEKVDIGQTGVQVTRLGLGGAPLSGMVLADGIYQGSVFEQALAIVHRAYWCPKIPMICNPIARTASRIIPTCSILVRTV